MLKGRAPSRAVAIDLGGTRFRVAVGTDEGLLEWRVSQATEVEQGRDAVLERIFSTVDEALATVPDLATIQGIGIGAPGPLDPWTGVVFNPPNLPGWDDTPLKALFESRFGLRTMVNNDANLAAVGEHRYGAGRGFAHIVYVTVSTGIGGGVIVDNQLLLGHCGFAGEVGHMTIDMDGPPCPCGNVGCLETLASGTAIARQARHFVAAGAETSLAQLSLQEVTAKAVSQAADEGDLIARRILHEAGVALGIGMVNISHLYNPQRVILGGGVSNSGDLLWEPMRQTLRTRALTACQRDLEIVPAALGDDAGIFGALVMALPD